MKYAATITKFTLVDEIKDYWTPEDFVELLNQYDYPDADTAEKEELRELLFMAITDFKPNEAANILLTYKLSDHLSKGQIDQLSNDMLEDKISEEYPDIALHAPLFHVNQLLHKAYNGKFPKVKASITEFDLKPLQGKEEPVSKEMVLKVFAHGLSDSSIIKRLFEDQLNGMLEFPEAENVIWELSALGDGHFRMITSEYWLNREDFSSFEFEGKIVEFEGEQDI